DRHGALLILDEVFCGMGRTGAMHAWEHEGVSPDIQTVAKGLGAGYQPIAAILVQGRIAEAIAAGSGTLWHGHTYTGHPVACAASLAVQQVLAEEKLVENAKAMGQRLRAQLDARFGNHPNVGDIRGRGLLVAIELVADRATKAPFAAEFQMHARIKREALDRGLATYTRGGTADGKVGDHALLAPPYIVTPAEVDRIVDILGEAVDAAVRR
ncbi:MAG: aminotransferase class III-fold pyridoxal phosphate-dependent enzyme, partial [Sphingomonadaceae bacterium]|nr:aminotransferase class III-fold pyridoxal phosphate-dependent enzyme [Sphingomonadaceae bacterium]